MPAIRPPPDAGVTSRSALDAQVAQLLGGLQPDGPLPGDDVEVVEGGHQHGAALAGEPGGDRLAGFGEAVVEDDLGAVAAGGLDLHPGASAGITMIAGMPSSLAASATPWAWLPEEKATTPRRAAPASAG